MINPETGLEEEVKTDSGLIEAPGFKKGQVGIPGVNLIDPNTKVKEKKTFADLDQVKVDSALEKFGEDEVRSSLDKVGIDTTTLGTVDPILPAGTDDGGITGLDPKLDKALGDLKKEKEKTLDDTYQSYNIAKGEYERNKDYYQNYDEVNDQFNSVLKDMQSIQERTDGANLTDQDYQTIADRYNLTIDEVRDPTQLFNKLNLTTEGEEKFGVTKFGEGLTDLETDFDRRKADLATNLQYAREDTQTQIDDVRAQIERNVSWATAQGAWMGGLKSSGYGEGIQNIKDDGDKVIDKLETALSRMESADEENVSRLTDDYNTAVSRAKTDLDDQLETLKFDNGLKLNGLTEKYGLSSTALTDALNKVQEEFGTKSLDAFNKYISSVKNIQSITSENINQYEKLQNIESEKVNQRYTEYIDNQGLLLQNTNLRDLETEVKNKKLSLAKYNDLKNIMLSSVTSTLGTFGTVDSKDLQTINSLLSQGKTPTEIVATMRKDEKFTEAKDPRTVDKTVKISDDLTQVYFSDGTSEILGGEEATNIILESTADFSTNRRGTEELQCGELVNDYILQSTGINPSGDSRMMDTLDSKIKAIDSIGRSNQPVIGGLFVSNPLGNEVGHTGIVQAINADGSIEVLEANADGKTAGQKPVVRTYDIEDMKDVIFSKNIQKAEEKIEFSQSAKDWGQNILSGDAKLSDITGDPDLKTETSSYIASKAKTSQNTNIVTINDSIALVDLLLAHPGLSAVVGTPDALTNPLGFAVPGTEAASFKAKLEQLTAANFMTGIQGMKGMGSLSDAEGRKVGASVSSISDVSQKETDFIQELNRLKSLLEGRLQSTEEETGVKYDSRGFSIDSKDQVDLGKTGVQLGSKIGTTGIPISGGRWNQSQTGVGSTATGRWQQAQ